MSASKIPALLTPRAISPNTAFIVGCFALLALACLDYWLGKDIRIDSLYVIPLGMVAINCNRRREVGFAFLLMFVLQALVLFSYDTPRITKWTSLGVAALLGLFVLVLSRLVSASFLRLRQTSSVDSPTGLHNRSSFESLAEQEIARHRRYGGVFSLVVIDLDHFKALNDSRGHAAGDAALKLFAKMLVHLTRETDVLARIGGDEFAILMPNTTRDDCASHCQGMVVEIAKRMTESGLAITASMGAFTIEQPVLSFLEAYEQADKAMYEAKAKGKNTSVNF